MFKKWRYSLLFLILCIISCFVCFLNKSSFFTEDADSLWKYFRVGIIGAAIAFLITAVIFVICERKKLKPYFEKFYTYRSLLYQLVRRDFKAKYKRSVLGILWTVLNPLLTMLILTIVFSAIFRFDIPNYPVYLLSGQIIFTFFSESTSLSMNSILVGAGMIKKVSMPKYIFPISRVLSSLVNFLLSLIALFLVMIITGAPIYWNMFLMPIPILYTLVFSLGIGLLLSAAVVFFRDMIYLYGLAVTLLMYLTPLFYPDSIIPAKYHFLLSLNPLYHFVQYFRTVTIYGGIPSLWQNIVCAGLSIISLTLGLYVFYKKQDRFILYI